jgi:hypothetical protein
VGHVGTRLREVCAIMALALYNMNTGPYRVLVKPVGAGCYGLEKQTHMHKEQVLRAERGVEEPF